MGRISKKLNKKRVIISNEQMEKLEEYDWPGNVRELENYVELSVNTESVPEISWVSGSKKADALEGGKLEFPQFGSDKDECIKLEQVERRHIVKVLSVYRGNVSLTAKKLGIGRNTLYRKLESYGIDCSETRR
jgi:DNA-binding NtrC family response regulator